MLNLQAQKLRVKLGMLDGTIKLFDPRWKPAKGIAKRRPTRQGRLPVGEAARAGIKALKQAGKELSTADIVAAVAKEHDLAFATPKDREDFASCITMAMRRYEKRGLVGSAPAGKGNARLWRLTLG